MGIPILLYHTLYERETNRERYAISARNFESQMRYLYDHGFRSLSLDDLSMAEQISAVDRKKIAITFDDGNESDYSIALPILKKYGLMAIFFLTVGRVSSHGYLNWRQVTDLNTNGMSIQSHGLTHSFLSDLKNGDLRRELLESKEEIQLKLGKEVKYLSLPGGFGSPIVLKAARDSGYRGVCTSRPGLNLPGQGAPELGIFRRIILTKRTSFKDSECIAGGKRSYVLKCQAGDFLKDRFKKILGSKVYYTLWSKFVKYS